MTARISPATAPYDPTVQAVLDKIMPPGVPPLTMFTTLANDPWMFGKIMAGGLLDECNLTMRQREILIHRVTAQNKSEYEWGIHALIFAPQVKMNEDHLYSTVHGGGEDACWALESEQLLIKLCDELQTSSSVSQPLWEALSNHYSEMALMEMLMVCGYYRTIAYLTNGMQLPLEKMGKRFPEKRA